MLHRIYFLFGLLVLVFLSSCHVGRFFYWNFADLDDNKKFASRPILNNGENMRFQFLSYANNDQFVPPTTLNANKEISWQQFLKETKTVAFMVIRNDSILCEYYPQPQKYQKDTDIASFSVAKSFVGALVGIAVQEGFIKSTTEPIIKYLPELAGKKGFEQITIQHVLDMRSGIKNNESYINPFGDVAKYYYGRNLKKYIKQLKVKKAPDTEFDYISVNTQILSLIVERATQQPIEKYLEAKIWQPLGMEFPASWSVDSRKHQTVKSFCCLNAKMRDFAKFGRLYLNKGIWDNTQIINADWINKTAQRNGYNYSNQWWQTGANDYFAQGILGQYIYLHPQKNMIILRFGLNYGHDWPPLFAKIAKLN